MNVLLHKCVLVIYCCLTNYPQNIFIISKFLWIRNLGALLWVPLSQDHSQGCNQVVSGTAVISRLDRERTRLRTHSCGCRQPSSPRWLLVGDVNSLPHASPRRQLATWQLASLRGREGGRAPIRSHSPFVT